MPKSRDEATLSEQFGSLIYRLRDSRNLSQRAAARLIGISQARLASVEQGRHSSTGKPTLPSPDLVIRIAATYGFPKDQLLLLAGYSPWTLNQDEAKRALEAIEKAFI